MKTEIVIAATMGLVLATSVANAQEKSAAKKEFQPGKPLGTPNEAGQFTTMTSNVKVFGSFRFAESCTYDAKRNLIVVMNAGVAQSLEPNDGYVSLLKNGFNASPADLEQKFLGIDLSDEPALVTNASALIDDRSMVLAKLYSTTTGSFNLAPVPSVKVASHRPAFMGMTSAISVAPRNPSPSTSATPLAMQFSAIAPLNPKPCTRSTLNRSDGEAKRMRGGCSEKSSGAIARS